MLGAQNHIGLESHIYLLLSSTVKIQRHTGYVYFDIANLIICLDIENVWSTLHAIIYTCVPFSTLYTLFFLMKRTKSQLIDFIAAHRFNVIEHSACVLRESECECQSANTRVLECYTRTIKENMIWELM